MLWLVCVFNYADRQSIFSIFPKLHEELGLDPVQLGLIGSAFMWIYAFGSPLAGFIGDRVARKPLILGGCLAWSLVTGLTGFCSRFWQFVTVRALEGAGETFYFPASLSLMSDYHGPRTRSRAMSIHQSGVYVGTILGSWLGAWFAIHLGWRVGFYFFGITGAVLALVLFRFLREPARGAADRLVGGAGEGAGARAGVAAGPHAAFAEVPPVAASTAATPLASGSEPAPTVAPGVAETLRIILARPTAWILMLVFLGANFVATIFLTWTPTFLVEKFHFQLVAAGLSGAIYIQVASAVGSPLGGWLADLLAPRIAGGRMLIQAVGLLAGATFVALVAHTAEVGTLLVAMTCFGFCKGLYDSNIWPALYDVIEPRLRATATGIMNTVGWGGGALGPVFVGWMAQHGRRSTQAANMSHAIGLGAGVYIAAGVALLILIATRGRRDLLPVPAVASLPPTA
jgi:MFS family permease